MNFFALTRGPEDAILRLPMTQDLQKELGDVLLTQEKQLRPEGCDEVPFDGRYVADESEILVLEKFVVPEHVAKAAGHPLSVATLDLSTCPVSSIHAILGTSPGRILCQAFDRRRALSTDGLSIINTMGTFKRLLEQGLTLDDHLAAVVKGGTLYFRSFAAARRVFDLASYYREATNEDLTNFVKSPNLHVKDESAFFVQADSWTRRKIALILASEVLKTVKPTALVRIAAKYGLTLNLVKVGGVESVALPESGKELKRVLRLLDEDFFTSEITTTRFVTNSKHRAE